MFIMVVHQFVGAVNSGLISSRVKSVIVELLFFATLLDTQHERNSVKNNPASLLPCDVRKGT